jgi:hypothetical protein
MERVRLRSRFTPPLPPVLISESADEQAEIRKALEQEIKPIGIIEKLYVADIASMSFEVLRLRRCKTAIINTAFRAALQDVLARLLREPGLLGAYPNEAATLALGWFTDEKARKKVLQTLSKFQLDESAIEAEAIRRCSSDLERIEGLLASLELRRTRALSCIAEYRTILARQLQASSDRIIDAKTVRRLEHASNKNSAAA